MYEDKQVRDFLGFDFDEGGELRIKIPKKEFKKGFKKIVQDAVEKKIDSRILNTEKHRQKYLASFSPLETPKHSDTSRIITSKSFKENNLTPKKTRKYLAPRDIDFTLPAPGVRRLLEELQIIDYHKLPNATHDLLRTFLECSLKAYFSYLGKDLKPIKGDFIYLKQVLQEFKKEMDAKKNMGLSQVTQKIISDKKMTSYSAEFMNATNHNPDIFSTDKEVEEAWDRMENLFRYVLAPKKNAKNTL